MAIWTFSVVHKSIVSSTVRGIIISDGWGRWKESGKKLYSLNDHSFPVARLLFWYVYRFWGGKTFVNKMEGGKKRQLETQNQIIISSIPWIKNTRARSRNVKKKRRSSRPRWLDEFITSNQGQQQQQQQRWMLYKSISSWNVENSTKMRTDFIH